MMECTQNKLVAIRPLPRAGIAILIKLIGKIRQNSG